MRANSKFVEYVRKWEYSFLIVLAHANRKIILLDINPSAGRKKDKRKIWMDDFHSSSSSLWNAIHQGIRIIIILVVEPKMNQLYLRKLFRLFRMVSEIFIQES